MNKYNFKVGDKVRIRIWIDMVKEFGYGDEYKDDIPCGDFSFTSYMLPSCGATATIIRIGTGDEEEEVDLLFDDEEIEVEFGKRKYIYVFNMVEPL